MAKYGQIVATGIPAGVSVIVKDSTGQQAVLYPEPNSNLPLRRGLTADTSGAIFPAVYALNGTYTVLWTGGSQSVTVSNADGEAPVSVYVDPATQAELNAVVAAASGTYEAIGSGRIDLCKAPYNATAGQDITTALQAAVNAIAALPNGGEIYFSNPGTYLLNGAAQTGTALGYTYNGQILFPAVSWLGGNSTPIRICGLTPASSGYSGTGLGNGVIIQSNATGCYMFDCVPGTSQWGWQWTGIMPIFENIILRSASGGVTGGVNALCAIRARFERFQVDAAGWAFTQPTGTLHAIAGPHGQNNGDTTFRDVSIRGMPIGIRIAEHYVLDNVAVIGCNYAFEAGENNHSCWFGYVDVEECASIFYNPSGRSLTVVGHLDVENTAVNGAWNAPTYLTAPGSFSVTGALSLNIVGTGGLALSNASGNTYLDLALLTGTISSQPVGTLAGWKSLHPSDNFARMAGHTVTGSGPGQCWPTLHPWRMVSNTVQVVAGQCSALSAGTVLAVLPTLNRGVSRRITMTATTKASGYYIGLWGHRLANNSSGIEARINGGTVTLYVAGTSRASGGTVAGSTAYTLAMDLIYSDTGAPIMVKVFLAGALLFTYALSATEIATLTPAATAPPEDGFGFFGDTGSFLTSFVVTPITAPIAALATGTATLVAGTVTVTNANITASSVIRLNRQAAGGTLGQLSVALTAGTGFTINSSSGTDTSTVYYEVVSY